MPDARSDRTKQSADKRRTILVAASQVFAEKGFHATRISDIARRAEIAYGLVYHYFKNKEEILDTIFLERWNLFLDAVQAIRDDGRGVEQKLLSIAAVVLSAYRKRPEWVQVIVSEMQRTPHESEPVRAQLIARFFGQVEQILREGQRRGELRTDLDPQIACYVFVGSLDIIVGGGVLGAMAVDDADGVQYAKIARTVVDVFLNGMSDGCDRSG